MKSKMKSVLAVASLIALGAGSLAQAQTVIHVTGSTAFRGAANNAFGNVLQSGWKAGFVGSSLSGANQAVYVGTTTAAFGSLPVVIETDFTGSSTGVIQTSNQTTLTGVWLSPTGNGTLAAGVNATAPATVSGGTSLSSPVFVSAPPDATFADVYQASTPVGNTLTALTDAGNSITGVGGVAFIWAAGVGSPAPVTTSVSTTTTAGSSTATVTSALGLAVGDHLSDGKNVQVGTTVTAISGTTLTLSKPALVSTSATGVYTYKGLSNVSNQLAEAIFKNGSLPLSQFSGSTNDTDTNVFLVGRSPDSGTRAAAIQEAYEGYDLDTASGDLALSTNLGAIQQNFPIDSNGLIVGTASTAPIASFELTPAVLVDPVFTSIPLGGNGYASGGNVASALINANGTSDFFVAYVGESDAQTALNGNAVELTYNGFAFSHEAIDLGQYTFWSYEHLYKAAGLSTNQVALAGDIASQIEASDALVSGVRPTDLTVGRNNVVTSKIADGTVVF